MSNAELAFRVQPTGAGLSCLEDSCNVDCSDSDSRRISFSSLISSIVKGMPPVPSPDGRFLEEFENKMKTQNRIKKTGVFQYRGEGSVDSVPISQHPKNVTYSEIKFSDETL